MASTIFQMQMVILNDQQIDNSMSYLIILLFSNHYQAIEHPSVDLCFTLITIGTNLANLLLYCYYGKQTTDYYGAFGDCLFESKWYNLPVDLQKVVLMVIGNAQQPLFYHGFRVARINLETFTSVSLDHSLIE